MLILFTKISKFNHENPQFLRQPIKFAIVDPSTAPDYTTKLTIKATERIFVGAQSKQAFELQNDREKYFLLTKKMYFCLITFKSIYNHVHGKRQMIISCSAYLTTAKTVSTQLSQKPLEKTAHRTKSKRTTI